jgi:hypothetical protein
MGGWVDGWMGEGGGNLLIRIGLILVFPFFFERGNYLIKKIQTIALKPRMMRYAALTHHIGESVMMGAIALYEHIGERCVTRSLTHPTIHVNLNGNHFFVFENAAKKEKLPTTRAAFVSIVRHPKK